MSIDYDLAWYGAEWAVRIAALAVVPLRRSAASSRAWLLLIFFLPVPGVILYLAVGTPRFPPWRARRFRALHPFFAQTADALARYAGDADAAPVAAFAQALGYLPATTGNEVVVLDDYDAVIDRLVADIDAATRSVQLLVYIFADDAVGRRVAAALRRAVARGVAVRVMFDPVGSHRWRKRSLALLNDAGVAVREALPLRWFRRRTRRDMRNHRKLFVIDSAIGYAGSLNIVAKDFRPGIVNRELVARIRGPVVAGIAAIVEADWSMETGTPPAPVTPPAPCGPNHAQLLPSGSSYPLEGFESLLVWQIHQARTRVIIVTPYFIPDEDILAAMSTAVKRGVRIDLIVSKVVDQRIVNLSQSSYYDGLLGAGVHIHRFRDFLLHAKSVAIDDRLAVIGSSNVDLRSFQLNEEASLLLYDAASIRRVGEVHASYLAASDPLDRAAWRRRPRSRKLAENTARLVNSLL